LFEKFDLKSFNDEFDTKEITDNTEKIIHWKFIKYNIESVKNIVFSDGVTEEDRMKNIENNSIYKRTQDDEKSLLNEFSVKAGRRMSEITLDVMNKSSLLTEANKDMSVGEQLKNS